ncbi:NAD-dependent epimerase/dehydratase family protein [Methylocaldum sp.]|uniref:NAD-dependent epimerase/dehydratase family protein n=1 Tax=Methylocaldum sp. TaxID=1969727 RepID=UPI002D3BCAFA|nr:NAD-dependent epimerase/dehydratase family protein [Methylocaldum sp.]HYE33874.1 NAD-dependent epimerase/dehydratase family protein [Methylocaldum sp.]
MKGKRQPSTRLEQGQIKDDPRPVLITGGAGFVGTNLADRLLDDGIPVLIFDNLWRPGVERNLNWLCATHGDRVQVEIADIRDFHAVQSAVHRARQVFHFAAQVAVTTSIENPIADFEVNLRGTFNVLEALRSTRNPPPLVYTSTNKVYGDLGNLAVHRRGDRYMPLDEATAKNGVGEDRPLDFHSPYGCSKGGADQYILDYARIYELPAAVFRMSCIYGPHQHGTEDQGWVAHFLIRALQDQPITIYGDGLQVRDVLFVEDLVRALRLAGDNIDRLRGQVFNIGGGPAKTTSLIELVDLIEELHGRRPELEFAPWRTGDQKYYVSDTRKLNRAAGWQPEVTVRDGVAATYEWLLMYSDKQTRYKPAMVAAEPAPSSRFKRL